MKKILKYLIISIVLALSIIVIYNAHNWAVSGKQTIKVNTSQKAYANNDLYVSVVAQKDNVDLDTNFKLNLKDSKGKRVKDTKISYDKNNAIISIPNVQPGNYLIEGTVSSKAGKDKIEKKINISSGKKENITITCDKGIYKPGDVINYRALITNKNNDTPVSNDVNVSIFDGNDNKVYNENLKTSDYGIISGKFKLADEVNSGIYQLVVKTKENETEKSIKVNPYITPKYEVKITYDKENYLVGDTAKININTKYFFGEPVQNANIKLFIDNKEIANSNSDEQGNMTIEYKISSAKKYNVKVEAVDSSNYYVEETSEFTSGTDLFNVQLLPEYGELVGGRTNTIYVFTSNNDGTPLKTYVNISSDRFTKQIATDENGIGSFSADIENVSTQNNYRYYWEDEDYEEDENGESINTKSNYNKGTNANIKKFNVSAQDMDGKSIRKDVDLKITQKNLLLNTDKVKYEQGEDIKLSVLSTKDNAKSIYFFKNDKLIKMLNSDSSESSVNLGEEYGVIDIYITESSNISSYYDYYYETGKNSYKKTVFIMPKKELKINIATDKNEYKPGENISIGFNTTDENNSNVDAALLVSMLDNSVLNLAENDLSIDNIKLALNEIKFSDELDATTLYTYLINNKSEQAIMTLLLKQKDRSIGVSESNFNGKESASKSAVITILAGTCLVLIIVTVLCIKYKTVRKIMKHMLNYAIFNLLMICAFLVIIEVFEIEKGVPIILTIVSIVSLTIYILFISKIAEKITRTSISLVLTIIISTFLVGSAFYVIEELEVESSTLGIGLILISILLLIGAIVLKTKEKQSKVAKKIVSEIEYIMGFAISELVSIIIGLISMIPLGLFLGLLFRYSDINEDIIQFILIINIILLIYVSNYFINKLGKKQDEKQCKPSLYYTLLVLSYPIVLIMLCAPMWIFSIINTSTLSIADDYSYSGGGIPQPQASGADSSKGSGGIASIIDSAESLLPSGRSLNGVEENIIEEKVKEDNQSEYDQSEKDENIRNVFLESMCFIPELVTKNGNGRLDLKLSDNITTWTIQTVGNTKDGRIGFGSKNDVKVFKEFFVDFELPKNLVDTDKVSIPVTVYNYTDNEINTTIKIQEAEWFELEKNNIDVNINAKSTNMVYVPIKVKKAGNNKFRAEITSNSLTDIVEKECDVSPKGYKVEKVVSTGRIENSINEDVLLLEDVIQDTANVKVKLYPNSISQTIEGMENIFKMPTGCFEQVSSSLYPNILALKYLEDGKIVNEEIRQKALDYISSGYQKLLTYEVKGEKGGYSLYGHSPAETVLTAYGLMEISDLSKVYNVDENVINNMRDYLYGKQKTNGSFEITGSHIGGANSYDDISKNAYIIWALSEVNPDDKRLETSVKYLKDNLEKIKDNYTIALVANVLANVKDKETNDVVKRLINSVQEEGGRKYISSDSLDYYGSRGITQSIQTSALTSMALLKTNTSPDLNNALINYIISQKDTRGTWRSTQATIFALKAINANNDNAKLSNQTVKVRLNQEEQKIDIKDNPIGLYELNFKNVGKENKLNIDLEKGKAYYEVVEEYYIPYEKVDTSQSNIEIAVNANTEMRVNDILRSDIRLLNRSGNNIENGMVTISIPQGFSVIEESLSKLETKGIIEKYEMNYNTVNVYLRKFEKSQIVDLNIEFRANYPVEITGLDVKAYDYYNPEVDGKSMPISIKVD